MTYRFPGINEHTHNRRNGGLSSVFLFLVVGIIWFLGNLHIRSRPSDPRVGKTGTLN